MYFLNIRRKSVTQIIQLSKSGYSLYSRNRSIFLSPSIVEQVFCNCKQVIACFSVIIKLVNFSFRANMLNHTLVLRLSTYLTKEEDYVPLLAVTQEFSTIMKILPPTRPVYKYLQVRET